MRLHPTVAAHRTLARRFGQVLDELSGSGCRISAGETMTIRLLMRMGCRKNEIMTLRWEHVDLSKAEKRIANGNTGSHTGHLSPTAVRVLKALPREPGNLWGVPGTKPETHMADIEGAWQTIRARRAPCRGAMVLRMNRAIPRMSIFSRCSASGSLPLPPSAPLARASVSSASTAARAELSSRSRSGTPASSRSHSTRVSSVQLSPLPSSARRARSLD